jgi:hypothetical protein
MITPRYVAMANVPMTIGPWSHLDFECLWESLRQGMTWFDAHLKGDRAPCAKKRCRYL